MAASAFQTAVTALLASVLCACTASTSESTIDAREPSPARQADAGLPSRTSQPATDMAAGAGASTTTASADSTAAPAATAGAGWLYDERTSPGGPVPRARIMSQSGNEQLVFEHHPISGRDAILILSGALGCQTGCKVSFSRDGGPPSEIRASRPPSQDVRLSLRQPRELWVSLKGVHMLKIEYVGADGPVTATFNVAGVEIDRLRGWGS